jgi:hypothetical protein
MIPHRIEATAYGVKGKVFLMGDPQGPSRGSVMGQPDEFPEPIDHHARVLLLCHPDDEQRIRDVIAREQEAPKVWRDWQRLVTALNQPGPAEPDHRKEPS